jgi:hypothetical protein
MRRPAGAAPIPLLWCVLWAGCGPTLDGGADLGSADDLAVADDLAAAHDLASPADLSRLDDLSRAADLANANDLATTSACVDVTEAPTVIATAASSDEFALTLDAQSASATSWAQAGNEALVLDVLRGSVLVGHLVLHQGRAPFTYGMHVGALSAGDPIAVRVSARSAPAAQKQARVCTATLRSATDLGPAGEGLKNAPVFLWPAAKTFDDLPLLLGWSRATQHYEIVYTSENGGTVASCGGGASGMRAELARWGRGCDIEGAYSYGGTAQWLRCTGTTTVAANAPRFEGAHPIFYYGDGHNRLFESRGGYGTACGTGAPEHADGDLAGWDVQNPGNEPANDAAFTVTLRPLPVDLDALGFAAARGRREGLVDTYAPWLYRITHLELAREGKIDGSKLLPLERYLYVDVEAADVDGSGDRVCALPVSKGFVLRVKTTDGVTLDGPQMTASYMGGNGWKRLAIPLDRVYSAGELTGMTFDAYDRDGIYLLAIGDAFMARASGDNGATLERLRSGARAINVYVDDDSSSCAGGVNHGGPAGDATCVGGQYDFAP